MARKINERARKPLIIVFWEGESEEQYIKFMRQKFNKKANIIPYDKKGLFLTAKKAFGSKGKYSSIKKEVDEVWFIFDTEPDMRDKWNEFYREILRLRKMNSYIRVRLLMTKGCIEYFFLLHFEKTAQTIVTVSDKEKIMDRLILKYCNSYKKGDKDSIYLIAENYNKAIENGKWSLERIREDIGDIGESDIRDKNLFVAEQTFTTVHEAVQFLENIKIS